MDKQLIRNLIQGNYKRSQKDDFDDGLGGKVKVFVIETDESRCRFWNSSNNSPFDIISACAKIADRVLQEDEEDFFMEDTVDVGLKEIYFEIEEK